MIFRYHWYIVLYYIIIMTVIESYTVSIFAIALNVHMSVPSSLHEISILSACRSRNCRWVHVPSLFNTKPTLEACFTCPLPPSPNKWLKGWGWGSLLSIFLPPLPSFNFNLFFSMHGDLPCIIIYVYRSMGFFPRKNVFLFAAWHPQLCWFHHLCCWGRRITATWGRFHPLVAPRYTSQKNIHLKMYIIFFHGHVSFLGV